VLVDENEIAALAIKYGAPARWRCKLGWSRPLASGGDERWWLATPHGRRGEIMLVMPRPQNQVLVHIKTMYPPNAFRLMTGGVEYAERVEDAARREIMEETGLDAPLEKFLGVLEYEFNYRQERSEFVSYIFETAETSAPSRARDATEEIAEFRQVGLDALGSIAQNLEHLPEEWYDWGRYRAVAHRLIYDLRFAKHGS